MEIKILKNEAEYEKAMEEVSRLMGKKRTPAENNAYRLLVLVIQDYEQRHATPLEFDPVETIQFHMEQQGLSKKDLVPYLGSMSRVSEVLSRKRHLSLSMIQRLHEGLEIPLESLIQRRPSRTRAIRTHRKRVVKKKKVKVSRSRKKSINRSEK